MPEIVAVAVAVSLAVTVTGNFLGEFDDADRGDQFDFGPLLLLPLGDSEEEF